MDGALASQVPSPVAGSMAPRWVNGEVLVFENDVEWNVFGFETCNRLFGQIEIDLITFANFVRRLRLPTVHQRVAVFDQTPQP